MRLINEILNLILGYKYKAVILKDRGVARYWLCSYIFEDTPKGHEKLKKYLNTLEESVTANTYVETITFRSRNEYFARPEKVEIILPSKDGRNIHPEMFKEKRTPIS